MLFEAFQSLLAASTAFTMNDGPDISIMLAGSMGGPDFSHYKDSLDLDALLGDNACDRRVTFALSRAWQRWVTC